MVLCEYSFLTLSYDHIKLNLDTKSGNYKKHRVPPERSSVFREVASLLAIAKCRGAIIRKGSLVLLVDVVY